MLLNPTSNTLLVSYAEPQIHIDELNVDFTTEAIRGVLKTLKDNKAPSLDRIPIEFIKNSPFNCVQSDNPVGCVM